MEKKSNNTLRLLATPLVGLVLLIGCEREPSPIPPLEKKNRTVIEYMIADNNLYANAVGDINEMEEAWSAGYDGSLVVYFYPVAAGEGTSAGDEQRPRLLLIRPDGDLDKINSQVLKYYERTQNPTDPELLTQVIRDAQAFAPADHYGLIFWSHGSGWVPDARAPRSVAAVREGIRGDIQGGIQGGFQGGVVTGRSFGEGGYTFRGTEMEIYDLAAAVGRTGTRFDFIAFDACHMASVEVAYQLKDYADYFVGSAAEIWSYGFPYHRMIPPMMQQQADVVAMGREFFDYYATFEAYTYRDATVVVLDNSKLAAVASAVNRLTRGPLTGTLSARQQYGRGGYGNTFYDLTDLVRTAWGDGSVDGGGALAEYGAAMEDAVVYKNATASFFGIQRVTYSGLSCYIPSVFTPNALTIYRSSYAWSRDSGLGSLVP